LVNQRSVLIIDDLDETREVLRTALECRGLTIFEARRAEQGLELARRHHPDLIVLDMEAEPAAEPRISDGFQAESIAHHTPMIMLGTARRNESNRLHGEFVAKPYHYGPLIRKIESLLDRAQRPLVPGE